MSYEAAHSKLHTIYASKRAGRDVQEKSIELCVDFVHIQIHSCMHTDVRLVCGYKIKGLGEV